MVKSVFRPGKHRKVKWKMIIPHQTHLSPERSNENENPVLYH